MPQAAILAVLPTASTAVVSFIQTFLINVSYEFEEAGVKWVCPLVRPTIAESA